MKRPLAYITAAWCGDDYKNTEQAARYCRAVYEAGFSPICPTLYLPLFLNDAVPEEHKNGIDMSRDLLRRSHVLVVCGHTVTEAMKNDIAVAQRLGITATTLDGILTVKGQGRTLFLMLIVVAMIMSLADLSSPSFIVSYITIIFSFFTATTVSYDEYDNCYLFLMTLPVTRKGYVNEKYVFGFISTCTAWLVGVTIGTALMAARHRLQIRIYM